MSSTYTVPTTSAHRGIPGRLWWVGFLTVLAAVMVNTLIAFGARALFPVAPTFLPLQPAGFLSSTVIGVVGAVIVFALIARWSKHPTRLFQRTVWVVLLVSLIPVLLLPVVGLYPGTTLPEVGALLLMHVATALICLGILPRAQSSRHVHQIKGKSKREREVVDGVEPGTAASSTAARAV